jgi:3-dehydroquinate synthase
MPTLTIHSTHGAYDVVVEGGSLAAVGELCRARDLRLPTAVVSNTTVGSLYGAHAAAGIERTPRRLDLPDGEIHKRWPAVERICTAWLEGGLHRQSAVLALGGGVVTDTTGFAAAVYLRGIDWIAAPTTLLAMVDAAVGGKTGVNLEQGKNLVGCFWPPRLVVADPEVLSSLPPRELRAGLAEVVKAAWIGDRGILDLVDRPVTSIADLAATAWQEIIVRSIAVKQEIVAADEREGGRRKALNLGHTLGHALETATGYSRFLHGEAVAWGLVGEGRLANRRGLLSTDGLSRLEGAVARLGSLPAVSDLDPETILAPLGRDKKRDHDGVGWVLPTDDGVELDVRVTPDELRTVLGTLGQPSS